MDILEFQGEHRWLSNFCPAKVVLDGVEYPTVENAYQAAKTTPEFRNAFTSCYAGNAKQLGRKVAIRPEWEQVKVSVMKELISQKFAKGTLLADKLLSTGDCHIEEGNYWGDSFWGVCRGKGQNILGKLIMDQRAFLRNNV